MRVDAIFTADWHIRNDVPVCRTDDYLSEQERKIDFILNLQKENNCIIFVAGDIFHKPRKLTKGQDNYWINKFYNDYYKICMIPGNHDLPDHNINNLNDSSLGILKNSKSSYVKETKLESIEIFPVFFDTSRKIGMIHKMIHKDNPLKINGKTISKRAASILRQHPELDVIISGDNHETFVEEYNGRLLVNPGSLMRMTADQINHKPCVFLYNAESNTVVQKFIPIKKDVISRAHIDKVKERDERLETFVSSMRDDVEITLNFENNLKEYMIVNKISENTKKYVWRSVND